MAFVMLSTGGLSASGVRTLSVRTLALGFAALALALIGLGGAAGYLVAHSKKAQPVAALPAAVAAQNPYTIEQLGALSGRVFKLENEAAHLRKKIGVLQDYEAQTQNRAKASDGKGGPMLQPRLGLSANPLAELDSALRHVEDQLDSVGSAAAQRNLSLMTFPSRLPVTGATLGSVFGNRVDPINHRLAFHAGLDFATPQGTPISAAAGGRVIKAGWNDDFGWVIEIDHGNHLVSRYAHTSKMFVQEGDVVVPGQQIALVGTTGRSTGPHLHFEILRDGEYADPQDYLAGL